MTTADANHPQVIIGIGQPGAGKTTKLKPLADKLSALFVSPDDLREEILGDYRDYSKNDEIWELIYAKIGDALTAGRDVVVDGAGINPMYRRMDIARYRPKAKRIVAYKFETPLEVSLKRNAGRTRPIPEADIDRAYTIMQDNPVQLDEGFDEIKVINN
jgi:predicted kinase